MTLIITRLEEDAESLIQFATKNNMEYFLFPCIEFVPPEDQYGSLDQSLRSNHLYDWVFFFSKRAAEAFFSRLLELGGQFFHLSPNLKIGVIGPKTKSFIENEVGFPVDFMPSEFNSDVFLEEFVSTVIETGSSIKLNILLPRTDSISDDFSKKLSANLDLSIHVEEISAYSSVCPEMNSPNFKQRLNNLKKIIDEKSLRGETLYLSFASSLTCKNFFILTESINWKKLKDSLQLEILSIGYKTSTTIKEFINWAKIVEDQEAFKQIAGSVMIKSNSHDKNKTSTRSKYFKSKI
jgi:uroporphyrinogen-III synthase